MKIIALVGEVIGLGIILWVVFGLIRDKRPRDDEYRDWIQVKYSAVLPQSFSFC